MNLLVASILAISVGVYQGEGLLNFVVVGKDYRIEDIKEIKNFTGLFFESIEDDDVKYLLVLDAAAWPKDPKTWFWPTLILLKDGKTAASVHVHVQRSEEDNELYLQWTAAPDFDDDSYLFIQMHPHTDDLVTMQIPFRSAKIERVSAYRKTHASTLNEVKELVAERRAERKKHPQNETSALEQTNRNEGGANRDTN